LSPLHHVSITASLEIAKLLIDHGANVHTKDYDGNSPLDYAKDPAFKAQLIAWTAAKKRTDTFWEIWVMETSEYDSYFQWPPREIVGDILNFLDSEDSRI
jgi:hypothetical protein